MVGFWKGKKIPQYARDKMSLAKLGKPSGRKGCKLTKEHKKNLSISHMGKSTWNKGIIGEKSHTYGLKHTKATKLKIRNYMLNITKSHRENLSKARSKQVFPFTDTKPEIFMQNMLLEEGINFTKHKPIKLTKGYHQVDLFIEPNICVEVDGYYWHNRPNTIERDSYVNSELKKQGYEVVRFYDLGLYHNPSVCLKVLYDVMGNKVI